MKKNSHLNKVVVAQNIGFLVIIVICILDEAIQLPALIFGDGPFVLRRSMLETLLILAVWLLVSKSTRRLLNQVEQLERFMRVCSWCHRINCKGEWMPMESFLHENLDTRTTHGICPQCLEKQQALIREKKEARKKEAELAAEKATLSPSQPIT